VILLRVTQRCSSIVELRTTTLFSRVWIVFIGFGCGELFSTEAEVEHLIFALLVN